MYVNVPSVFTTTTPFVGAFCKLNVNGLPSGSVAVTRLNNVVSSLMTNDKLPVIGGSLIGNTVIVTVEIAVPP